MVALEQIARSTLSMKHTNYTLRHIQFLPVNEYTLRKIHVSK